MACHHDKASFSYIVKPAEEQPPEQVHSLGTPSLAFKGSRLDLTALPLVFRAFSDGFCGHIGGTDGYAGWLSKTVRISGARKYT